MFSIGLSQDNKYDIYSHLMLQQHPDSFDCSLPDNDNFPKFSEHSSIGFDQDSIENVYFESLREDYDFWSILSQFNVESWGKYSYLIFDGLPLIYKLEIFKWSSSQLFLQLLNTFYINFNKFKIGEVEINFSSSFHSKYLFESSFDDWIQIRFEKDLANESNNIIQAPLQIFNANTHPFSIKSSSRQVSNFPIEEIKQDQQSSSKVRLCLLLVRELIANNSF